jgi:hypothetical protein
LTDFSQWLVSIIAEKDECMREQIFKRKIFFSQNDGHMDVKTEQRRRTF